MFKAQLVQLAYQGLFLILLLSGPPIFISMFFGLGVAIFQAATQIQEQTLTFVPKMIIVFLVISATFPWLASTMIELCILLWKDIPFYAR